MTIYTAAHKLGCPNPLWINPKDLPAVTAYCRRNEEYLSVLFDVAEPQSCFRNACRRDGDPCWQDSCVEIFVACGGAEKNYINIETNAAGISLGQIGASRGERRNFSPSEYACLRRDAAVSPAIDARGFVRWALQIDIPAGLLQLSAYDPVVGNLYKCASCAQTPHYLARFPVTTSATPDFHRPECFKNLFL